MIIVVLRNIICIIGLVALVPLFLAVSISLIIEDGFPIFFIQKRLGVHKKIFGIFKIGTMKKNTPQLGTHDIGDEFKLNTGSVIRALKLDEFPQLANVVKGDLNLVGPRPGLVNQLELLDMRSAKDIYRIKPGITGLGQILGYDMSDPRKLSEIDKIYLDNQSMHLNILIIMGTFFGYPRNYLASKFKIANKKKLVS